MNVSHPTPADAEATRIIGYVENNLGHDEALIDARLRARGWIRLPEINQRSFTSVTLSLVIGHFQHAGWLKTRLWHGSLRLER